jgi:histidinol phosphatase-like PHP family hydrolase
LEVFQAIKENGKAAEITAFQFNVELRDVEQMKRVYALARTTGVKFTLDSDAHSISEMLWGLGCLYVLAELGFTDDDFVDYQELKKLKNKANKK